MSEQDPSLETLINPTIIYEKLNNTIVSLNTLHENNLTEAQSDSQTMAIDMAEKIKDMDPQPTTKDEYERIIIEAMANEEIDKTAYELIMDELSS